MSAVKRETRCFYYQHSVCCPRNGVQAPRIFSEVLINPGKPSFITTVQSAWEGQMVKLVSPDTGQNK